MKQVRCPFCSCSLRATYDSSWEDIRTHAAVHLRRCCDCRSASKADPRLVAISLADEIIALRNEQSA